MVIKTTDKNRGKTKGLPSTTGNNSCQVKDLSLKLNTVVVVTANIGHVAMEKKNCNELYQRLQKKWMWWFCSQWWLCLWPSRSSEDTTVYCERQLVACIASKRPALQSDSDNRRREARTGEMEQLDGQEDGDGEGTHKWRGHLVCGSPTVTGWIEAAQMSKERPLSHIVHVSVTTPPWQ